MSSETIRARGDIRNALLCAKNVHIRIALQKLTIGDYPRIASRKRMTLQIALAPLAFNILACEIPITHISQSESSENSAAIRFSVNQTHEGLQPAARCRLRSRYHLK
jgi:hypothetical protein